MKNILKVFFCIFFLFVVFHVSLPKSFAYEDGFGGDTTDGDAGGAQGSAQAFADQAGWPPGSVSQNSDGSFTASDPNTGACGNSGSSATFGSSGGGGGDGYGGEPPPEAVCIPDGGACPQYQGGGRVCLRRNLFNQCLQYGNSQGTEVPCCTSCNNGVCGGGNPPQNPPPQEPPYVPPPACNQP